MMMMMMSLLVFGANASCKKGFSRHAPGGDLHKNAVANVNALRIREAVFSGVICSRVSLDLWIQKILNTATKYSTSPPQAKIFGVF